ncbi:aldo/keto reductase [Phanerochaete sordida]|uniref:Aldo/keto reductase n=1 Tax=Phanerochaete sordida TaxID=48140 RepID=A0A9P3GAK1_9APHY|nr:aldo/keto reductase [Phanerochaete sordida]
MASPADTSTKKMEYVRLGNSGLKVSRIIMGCMSYGHKGWYPWVIDDEDEACKHIKFAYDAGINTFDTANMYSNGKSEEILGRAIKKLGLPREELVIMTKLFGVVGPTYDCNFVTGPKTAEDYGIINQRGLSRKHIFDSVKTSLKRMQLEYIDVLQCHRFDYNTPIAETMQALHDVVQAGLVRYIGMSACWAYQFQQMQNYATTHKLTPFISLQNHYNLLYREDEREVYPTIKMLGVGSIPFCPLARGLCSRPLGAQSARGQLDDYHQGYMGFGSEAIINRIEELAGKKGVSMAQVSIAWLLHKGVTAPIVGTTNMANLQDIIGAIHVSLSDEEIKFLEEPYVPRPINGHA